MKSAFYILTVFKNGFSQTRENLNGILKNNLQKPRLEKNTNLNIQILIISSFCKQQVSKGPILQNFNVFCLRDNNLKLLESPGRLGTSTNLSCPNLSRCNVSIFRCFWSHRFGIQYKMFPSVGPQPSCMFGCRFR